MKRCPNCGRLTCRTEDWVCQWCGYPLLDKSYNKIPKTYKQLQEERMPLEPEAEVEPVPEAETVPELEPEPEPVLEPELIPEVEPVSEVEPVPEPELEPEPVLERELEPVMESESEAEPAPESEPEPVPEVEPEVTAVSELEPVANGVIEVSVEELNSAYQSDRVVADAKFASQVLRVSGVVHKAVVRDHLEIRYVILTGAERKGAWSVRCTFDKGHSSEVKRLIPGQAVAVQGTYDGYERHILMRDCVLV